MTNPVSNQNIISSVSNVFVGSSPIEIMAQVEMMLVQEYDSQMRDIAESIKQSTRLKETYRMHKSLINDLLSKERTGKNKDLINLTQEELSLLESKAEFNWDTSLNNQMGGIKKTFAQVATSESSEWFGDPHFNDADSEATGFNHTDFDFQGIAGHEYLYLEDSIGDRKLKMTGLHTAFGANGATVVSKINLIQSGKIGTTQIIFDANSKPTINGHTMEKGRVFNTGDGGTAMWDGKVLNVKTDEGYTIRLHDMGGYLNGQVISPKQGVMEDGNQATGLIGSQFDADEETNQIRGENFDITNPNPKKEMLKEVKVDKIQAELDRLQMRLDSLNSSTELAQTDLSTLTSQRKLAFESMSSMLAKKFDGASTVIRNIK